MILKIGNAAKPAVNNVIVAPELPSTVNFILLTDGNCLVSEQYAKKLGGQNHD